MTEGGNLHSVKPGGATNPTNLELLWELRWNIYIKFVQFLLDCSGHSRTPWTLNEILIVCFELCGDFFSPICQLNAFQLTNQFVSCWTTIRLFEGEIADNMASIPHIVQVTSDKLQTQLVEASSRDLLPGSKCSILMQYRYEFIIINLAFAQPNNNQLIAK